MQILTDPLVVRYFKLLDTRREYIVRTLRSTPLLIEVFAPPVIIGNTCDPNPCSRSSLPPFVFEFEWSCCDDGWLITATAIQLVNGVREIIYVEQRIITPGSYIDDEGDLVQYNFLNHNPPTYLPTPFDNVGGYLSSCTKFSTFQGGLCNDFEFESSGPLISYSLFLIRFESIFLRGIDHLNDVITDCGSQPPSYQPVPVRPPVQVPDGPPECPPDGLTGFLCSREPFTFQGVVCFDYFRCCQEYQIYAPIRSASGEWACVRIYRSPPTDQERTTWCSNTNDISLAYQQSLPSFQEYCSGGQVLPYPFPRFSPQPPLSPGPLECDALYVNIQITVSFAMDLDIVNPNTGETVRFKATATLWSQEFYHRLIDNDALEQVFTFAQPEVGVEISTEGFELSASFTIAGINIPFSKSWTWTELAPRLPPNVSVVLITLQNLPVVLTAKSDAKFVVKGEPCT